MNRQPIATAPKGSEFIHGYISGLGCPIAMSWSGTVWYQIGSPLPLDPTHWRPIPPLTAAQAARLDGQSG